MVAYRLILPVTEAIAEEHGSGADDWEAVISCRFSAERLGSPGVPGLGLCAYHR